jgi:ketosteroid isomerase-like protein
MDRRIMSLIDAPHAIVNFIETARAGNLTGLLTWFTADAVVLDDGREYRGQAIMRWAGPLIARPRRIVRPISAIGKEGQTIMNVIVQDVGSAATEHFEWAFTMTGQKIAALAVRQSRLPDMPAPVAAYVLATNLFDIDGLLDTFADDAVVNDQLYEYWGRDEIRHWALRDIIGQHTTIHVTQVRQRGADAVVTAHVDGSYDKRGLPDPLVLTFYFSTTGEKIVQLIILRNESRP